MAPSGRSAAEAIFRMVGDKTRAVVDNCDITLNQPDDAWPGTT